MSLRIASVLALFLCGTAVGASSPVLESRTLAKKSPSEGGVFVFTREGTDLRWKHFEPGQGETILATFKGVNDVAEFEFHPNRTLAMLLLTDLDPGTGHVAPTAVQQLWVADFAAGTLRRLAPPMKRVVDVAFWKDAPAILGEWNPDDSTCPNENGARSAAFRGGAWEIVADARRKCGGLFPYSEAFGLDKGFTLPLIRDARAFDDSPELDSPIQKALYRISMQSWHLDEDEHAVVAAGPIDGKMRIVFFTAEAKQIGQPHLLEGEDGDLQRRHPWILVVPIEGSVGYFDVTTGKRLYHAPRAVDALLWPK